MNRNEGVVWWYNSFVFLHRISCLRLHQLFGPISIDLFYSLSIRWITDHFILCVAFFHWVCVYGVSSSSSSSGMIIKSKSNDTTTTSTSIGRSGRSLPKSATFNKLNEAGNGGQSVGSTTSGVSVRRVTNSRINQPTKPSSNNQSNNTTDHHPTPSSRVNQRKAANNREQQPITTTKTKDTKETTVADPKQSSPKREQAPRPTSADVKGQQIYPF